MSEVVIQGQQELEAWLKARPEARRDAEAIVIAQRAALRVAPLWFSRMDREWAVKENLTALPVFRCLLFSFAGRLGDFPGVLGKIVVGRDAALAGADGAVFAYMAAVYATGTSAAKPLTDFSKWPNSSLPSFNIPELAATAAANSSNVFASRDVPYGINEARSIWKEVSNDATHLESSLPFPNGALWSKIPVWFEEWWEESKRVFSSKGGEDTWGFWIRWFEGAVRGNYLPRDLQEQVALIPNEVWDAGPEAVAEAIARIEAEYAKSAAVTIAPPPAFDPEKEIDRALAKAPPSDPAQVQRTAAAVSANRAELPATFTALEGYLELEIQRLQGINYPSEERQTFINTLMTILSVSQRLRDLVPETEEAEPEGEKIVKLGSFFVRLFQDWPRQNAAELVDTTCRVGIVGTASVAAVGIGVPSAIAVTLLSAAYLAPQTFKLIVKKEKG